MILIYWLCRQTVIKEKHNADVTTANYFVFLRRKTWQKNWPIKARHLQAWFQNKNKRTTASHQGWKCNGPFKQIVLTLVLDLPTVFKMDALENWSMIVVTIEIVISLLGIVFNGLVICKRQFAWTFIVSQHPASSYSALPWAIFSLVLWLFHFLL